MQSYLSKLKLYNFRNLANQEVVFEPGLNLIWGLNGQGKTNLIEAIGVLSHTKSFRDSSTSDLIRTGESEASVSGTVSVQDGPDSFEINLCVAIEGKKKTVSVNGNKVSSLQEFLGNVVTVSFTPTDLSLVKGAPAERRRFLDKHVVDLTPREIGNLLSYQRTLAHKNSLLRGADQAPPDEAALESLDTLLARYGAAIISARLNLIRQLSERAALLYNKISRGSEQLTLKYESRINAVDKAAIEAELFAGLLAHRVKDLARGSSSIGPHRDDLVVELSGMDARAFASQGQTRSVVLALKLTIIELIHERLGKWPVVLLDDVDSELDRERQRELYSLSLESGGQVLVTGTEQGSGFAALNVSAAKFRVEKGVVSRE